MICPTCRGRQFIPAGQADDDELVEMTPCPDCIGGIASCCDAARASAPPTRRQISRIKQAEAEINAEVAALMKGGLSFEEAWVAAGGIVVDDPPASYRDDTFPERLCDGCGALYRGPAVYCSLECAVDDA